MVRQSRRLQPRIRGEVVEMQGITRGRHPAMVTVLPPPITKRSLGNRGQISNFQSSGGPQGGRADSGSSGFSRSSREREARSKSRRGGGFEVSNPRTTGNSRSDPELRLDCGDDLADELIEASVGVDPANDHQQIVIPVQIDDVDTVALKRHGRTRRRWKWRGPTVPSGVLAGLFRNQLQNP